MKKYILFLAVFFAVLTAQAYDVNYAGCYKSFRLDFQSYDENNNPVTLSELVTVPLEKDGVTNREVGFFVLSSMPLNSDADKSCTGEHPMDALVLRTISTEGAMTVLVDDQGFGASEGHPVPFMVNKINGRQSLDGLLAAMDYCQENGIKVSDNYYTINAGYSLAGGRAIAVQRYLEKYSSAEDKARIRFRRTICGGAPADVEETAKFLLKREGASGLTEYWTLLKGLINCYRQGPLHAFTVDDFYDGDNLKTEVADGTSAAGRALWKALSLENMIEDWIPETPLTMIHYVDDNVIPYSNITTAQKAWGKDKINLMSRDLPHMKWNLSMIHPICEAVKQYAGVTIHIKGSLDFYSGMIDGCLRDTLLADMYGRTTNFKDMLTTLFDMSQGLNTDMKVNLSSTSKESVITIKTLGYCHFAGELADSTGAVTATFDVTARPEVLDSLSSKIATVDAKGFLHLPVDFKVEVPKFGVVIDGSCEDLYKAIESLSAIMLHRSCPTAEDAEKYCKAFNDNMHAHAVVDYTTNDIPLHVETDVVMWYKKKTVNKVTCYYIDPCYTSTSKSTGKVTYTKLADLLKVFDSSFDLNKYTTLDNQSFKVAGYNVQLHVTEENFGNMKLYADILKDSTAFGRVDFDITGVDMNEDGTLQTIDLGFTVNILQYHIKVEGRCNNINDALLAAALCYGNLSCETEAKAQGYVDAVNQNVQLELYMAKTDSDGNYPENPEYNDYGPVTAIVSQDEFGAYYAQYIVKFMGTMNLPLAQVLQLLGL